MENHPSQNRKQNSFQRCCHFTLIVIQLREYQLPVSATRWQHCSQICFATFIECKITKLLITQQPLKLEKISTYLESLEVYNLFDACLTNFENYQILLDKISHRFRVTTIEMKGKTRCKLTIISESAICKIVHSSEYNYFYI